MSDALNFTVHRLVPVEVALLPEDVLPRVTDADLRAECMRRGLLPPETEAELAGVHIRGARGLLDWSLDRLAMASGVSISTIKRMEDGTEGQIRPAKVAAVRGALQGAGVLFGSLAGETCILRAPAATAGTDGAR